MSLARIRTVAAFEWRGVVYQPTYWILFFLPLFGLLVSAGMQVLVIGSAPTGVPERPVEELLDANPMILRLVFAFGFVSPFLLTLFSSFGYLLFATVDERENRVGEVLLASMRADELIAGKLLGLGPALLFQMGVWMLLIAFGAAAIPSLRPAVPGIGILIAAGGILMLGQLFLASAFLAAACLGGSARSSQQIVGFVALLAMIPVTVGGQLFVKEPHGAVAHVLSWFPLTAPLVLSLRLLLAAEGIAWAEVAGVAVFLLVATWWTVRVAARLYRMSLVSAGAGIGWRAALRQARLAPDAAPSTARADVL